MILHSSTTITGHVQGEDDLQIDGRVNGILTLKQNLIISKDGIVQAHVQAQTVLVSGVVVGDINAQEKIELSSQARVVGNLRAPQVIISEGAQFKGKVDMGNLDESQDALPVSPKMSLTPNPSLAGIEDMLSTQSKASPHSPENQLPPISTTFQTIIHGVKRQLI